MTSFSTDQLHIISASLISPDNLQLFLEKLLKGEVDEGTDVFAYAKLINTLYRGGHEVLSDVEYDTVLIPLLERINPDHEFLAIVEPEGEAFEGELVTLSQRMLSTDKAYSIEEMQSWVNSLKKGAEELGVDADRLVIRATPKLDGFSSLDDGKTLVSRGNGYRGTNFSHILKRGVQVMGGQRGMGPGEIVISNEYFEGFLINHFDNTRNVLSAVTKESDYAPEIKAAVEAGAVVFYPFSELPEWTGTLHDFLAGFDAIMDAVWAYEPNYNIDGVVIECPELRDVLGHTSKFYRNTVAFKRNDKPVEVVANDVTYQTGKTGRITPVAELEPTEIGGVTVSRATLHNIGWMEGRHIGPASRLNVLRSGMVIPKVVGVITESAANLPTHCSSCGEPLRREGDNLWCDNKIDCKAQVVLTLKYFFSTLDNNKGFGEKTIEKLVEAGYSTLPAIYAMSVSDFVEAGFGDKTSQNLFDDLRKSRETQVEDWRFLAAFSLHNIGRGGTERLLKEYPLEAIFDLTFDQVIAIRDFGEIKTASLLSSLQKIKATFDSLMSLGFNLDMTPIGGVDVESAIKGKTVVFTGTMVKGNRKEMESHAKTLGAKVGGSVSSKTDLLVIGEKVGQSKMDAATKHGVTVISEEDYFKMIDQ